jgi:hypothetical protein
VRAKRSFTRFISRRAIAKTISVRISLKVCKFAKLQFCYQTFISLVPVRSQQNVASSLDSAVC